MTILQIIILFLPWSLRRHILTAIAKFELHPTSKIGLTVIKAKQVRLHAHSRIGHFNRISGLELLELAENAEIGNLNSITALPKESAHFPHSTSRRTSFCLGQGSAVTSRHLFDCNDGITIGPMTTIAGAASQFWTHEIDIVANQQRTSPISIGSYCYIGSRILMLAGTQLPDKVVVGAGSVVRGSAFAASSLIAGNPAITKKNLSELSAQYFERTEPYVR